MDKPKDVRWVGSSLKNLRALPKDVRGDVGLSLWRAQLGFMPSNAKALQGFGGATVLEIRSDHEGNAYRAVYTVRFAEFIYVLHVFQKKSKKGIKTPANILELVRRRLKTAEEHYDEWKSKNEGKNES